MTFPPVAATNTSSQDSASTSHPVAMPAGVQAGDLLVVVFTMSGSGSPTVSATGWTQIDAVAFAGGNASVHARIADGTEGSPVTFTSSNTTSSDGSAHNSYRITGFHNTGTVTDAVEGSWVTANGLDPPSLTPSWGSADTLWITTARTRRTDNTLTAPTNYINQLDAAVAGASSSVQRSRVASARRELAAASEDPDAWGSTGAISSERAGTFAVRPAIEPPDPPGNVAATAISSSCIDVDWNNVTGNTGYRVERSLDGVSGWVTAGTTGADDNTFQDCGRDPDTEYCYRVVTLSASGESSPSDVECATTFPAPEGLSVDNPTLGNFWVHAYEGDYSICAQTVAWSRTRPFGSVQHIEGGPPVTVTGRPGLRDYAFTIAVNSTADMIAVENIIAHPLAFVQFAGHHPDQWMAPRADSYQVIKVGRNRLATVQFVGVEPEPVPSPAEFL